MRETDIIAKAVSQAENRLTQKEKRISAYLLSRPEAILIENNSDIARKLDISPMTLTRFYRKIGFDDAADARNKAVENKYGPENSRVDQRFRDSFSTHVSNASDEGLELCHASVNAAFQLRNGEIWKDVVDRVVQSDAVHVTGFQMMAYLANGFSGRLSYLRDRVDFVDGTDGLYAGLLPAAGEKAALIIVDVFRYGAHGPILAKLARERGIDVIVFADEFCDWAGEITPYVLRYPAENNFFIPLPLGISTGLNLLLQDVSSRLGKDAKQRVRKLAEAQDHFGMFLD